MSNDNNGFKPRNKVEADLVNAGRLVANLFGFKTDEGPVAEAVEAARTHVGGIKGTDGTVVDYVECPTCHTHHMASKECPQCGAPPAPPRGPKDGPMFYCAWDADGAYRGAFVSPYQAHDAAGDGGNVRKLRAEDIPEG